MIRLVHSCEVNLYYFIRAPLIWPLPLGWPTSLIQFVRQSHASSSISRLMLVSLAFAASCFSWWTSSQKQVSFSSQGWPRAVFGMTVAVAGDPTFMLTCSQSCSHRFCYRFQSKGALSSYLIRSMESCRGVSFGHDRLAWLKLLEKVSTQIM